MYSHTFHVENIKCAGCMSTIKKNLMEIAGTLGVTIDKENGTVQIDAANEPELSRYTEALAKMGYPETGHNNMIQKAKSYVSCAIGRLDPQ